MIASRVLIVEDDPDVAEALIAALEGAGCGVTAANHGMQALELLRAGALPDVILLDQMMPVLDGRGFREAQLRDPRLAAVPVVLVSADPGAGEVARELGIARFLPKPFGLEALLETVRESLGALPLAGPAVAGR